MYKSIIYWYDGEDEKYPYEPNDEYPRKGLKPTKERIRNLSTKYNNSENPVIEKVE